MVLGPRGKFVVGCLSLALGVAFAPGPLLVCWSEVSRAAQQSKGGNGVSRPLSRHQSVTPKHAGRRETSRENCKGCFLATMPCLSSCSASAFFFPQAVSALFDPVSVWKRRIVNLTAPGTTKEMDQKILIRRPETKTTLQWTQRWSELNTEDTGSGRKQDFHG